ncbi:Alpha/Beta hydrolase protein [Lactarius quietus]|nr:Alpha/Beta hydrolase protein [Lactarius quietus]
MLPSLPAFVKQNFSPPIAPLLMHSLRNLKQIESECLNLNITCPGGITRESRLPVMVWVHGGGDRGSGSHWLYDGGPLVQSSMRQPEALEDNKLAGEDGVGNYGLRDQRRALEWVHDFITDFGGDGSNVTLFGASTGASDILSHLDSTSNASYPLFARAIVQSPIIEPRLPSVSFVGVHLSKVMSALRVSTIQELRKVPVDKLVDFTSGPRAVDDGYLFKDGSTETRVAEEVPQNHLHVPEKLTAQCVIEQHIADRTPVIIGDCNYESYGSRLGAICLSVKKANALLRAYDISVHTPDEEFLDRVLELINDARFAWPTHLAAEKFRSSRTQKESGGVWRYVFDQEAPGSGVPHHATDLLYLFDTARPAFAAQLLLATQDSDTFLPDRFDVDDDDDDDAPFDNSAFDNSAFDDATSDYEPMPSVDQYQYGAVRDALQSRWLAFAYGQAPWSRDKVFVFGPEGEAGERGLNIFESRRRTSAWRNALEPLGDVLAQKVGLELSNGPSGGSQLMQRQQTLEGQRMP